MDDTQQKPGLNLHAAKPQPSCRALLLQLTNKPPPHPIPIIPNRRLHQIMFRMIQKISLATAIFERCQRQNRCPQAFTNPAAIPLLAARIF